MKYCNSCKISYNTPLQNCLFCNNEIIKVNDNEEINYFPPVFRRSRTKRIFMKILSFFILVGNIACLYIDYISNKDLKLTWSILVVSSSLYVFFILLTLIKKYPFINKLYWMFFLTLLELQAIGIYSCNYHWATDFVLPFGIIIFVSTMTSFLFGSHTKLFDYTIFIILSAGFFLVPLILLITGRVNTNWPSIVCILYCIMTLLSLVFFRPKQVKEELQRRLHF